MNIATDESKANNTIALSENRQKDKHWPTKHYTENQNNEQHHHIQNQEVNAGGPEGKQFYI